MSMVGYGHRIETSLFMIQYLLGLSGKLLDDGLPYTTLSYANGQAFYLRNIPDPDDAQKITRYQLMDFYFKVDAAQMEQFLFTP